MDWELLWRAILKPRYLGAAVVGANTGLMHKPAMRVEGAQHQVVWPLLSAVDSIQAGTDITMVVIEVQTSASARVGGDYLARASHYARQRDIDDFTFPAIFARRIKACQENGNHP